MLKRDILPVIDKVLLIAVAVCGYFQSVAECGIPHPLSSASDRIRIETLLRCPQNRDHATWAPGSLFLDSHLRNMLAEVDIQCKTT